MSSRAWIDPLSLNIIGSTQPQLSAGRIAAMVQELQDPNRAAAFWQNSLKNDGPIEIWEINGQRFLYNGNHRWHAAVAAGINIPAVSIRVVQRPGCTIPTWPLNSLTRIP
jgi:hypothetical protein